MGDSTDGIDYTNWDWLPDAADQIQDYLERLLREAPVSAHSVDARAKSIASFRDKCVRKSYKDPMSDVTDTVAVRIITYSVTDRERAEELIRDRFQIKPGEDRNPGAGRDHDRRGYDCQHFVITDERPDADSGWLIAGGELSRYFETFGGLEIQIRTVAAHAWAEFEHSRRYKGHPYHAIKGQDRETVDLLFAAASDARSALDATFVAIDRVLANPSQTIPPQPEAEIDDESTQNDAQPEIDAAPTAVDASTLREHLAQRFPEDTEATDKGMEFACELVRACGLDSIEALSHALDSVDGEQVQQLMDTTIVVTRVRRLDDQLLAAYGENYITDTSDIGNVGTRKQQLEWRYDRLRDKVTPKGYKAYHIAGDDCPDDVRGVPLAAARTVRELVRVVSLLKGLDAAVIPEAVSLTGEDVSPSMRPVELNLGSGPSLWVVTNLSRQHSEMLMEQLLEKLDGFTLSVLKNGREIGATRR